MPSRRDCGRCAGLSGKSGSDGSDDVVPVIADLRAHVEAARSCAARGSPWLRAALAVVLDEVERAVWEFERRHITEQR